MPIITYEFLVLTVVRNTDIGLSYLIDDLEREVLHIRLDFRIVELAPDETLSIENTLGTELERHLRKNEQA